MKSPSCGQPAMRSSMIYIARKPYRHSPSDARGTSSDPGAAVATMIHRQQAAACTYVGCREPDVRPRMGRKRRPAAEHKHNDDNPPRDGHGPKSARGGQATFRLSTFAVSGSLAVACFSPESAPRPFHHGIRERGGTIYTAALPVTIGRSKRTCELTSSIVPRGIPFRHWVEFRFPPTSIGFANCSRGCSLSGPAELSAINPHAVHDHC